MAITKHEQKFTTEVQKWMRAHAKELPLAFAWEVKVTTKPNLFFSQIPDHQRTQSNASYAPQQRQGASLQQHQGHKLAAFHPQRS